MQIKVLILHHSIVYPLIFMAKILGWSPCKNAGSSGESALFYVSTSVLESSLCTTVTWLPVSDTPAVAAQLTVSDDLAAAAKKG